MIGAEKLHPPCPSQGQIEQMQIMPRERFLERDMMMLYGNHFM
jgi:hypothetical protein